SARAPQRDRRQVVDPSAHRRADRPAGHRRDGRTSRPPHAGLRGHARDRPGTRPGRPRQAGTEPGRTDPYGRRAAAARDVTDPDPRHTPDQEADIYLGEDVLARAVAAYEAALGSRLIAGYALGSLAHGGFSPLVSDVDLGLVPRRNRHAPRPPREVGRAPLTGRQRASRDPHSFASGIQRAPAADQNRALPC